MHHPTIAVCAVQGAFIEHEQRLRALGCETLELRQAADLARPFDALVLPGGESTVQAKLLRELGLFDPLRARIAGGMPVLGTCAGLILLAERIEDATGDLAGLDPALAAARTGVAGFGTLPVTVRRNGYGRQLGSFRAHAPFGSEDERATGTAPNIPLTFIRAPFITEIREEEAETGAEVRGGKPHAEADTGAAMREGKFDAETGSSAKAREGETDTKAEVLTRVDGRIVAARAGNQIGVAFHPELDEDDTVYQLFLGML
ncbi:MULTISPECIES: pyridoxal 5'-phosphate synthase glutaminase subunit PdxT [unclassified Adlercreutzia]|uniref:pyridoxal 5'-phosphate synthase glutaminase subunit PdxT n=1 Tax=unclassified Adlercreutzia TaxID=2636013 RepID=UPI001F14A455|nr:MULTISPECIES: pyridoxal 5'-phosphate synthase glutaminase subunit PdxT [unclassified Adlercreutzia]